MGDEETKQGALNRCNNCFASKEGYEDIKYIVGLEGGMQKTEQGYECFGWMCVMKVTSESVATPERSEETELQNQYSYSRTASFLVPPKVTRLLDKGMELGYAVDEAFRRKGTGKGYGVVGVVTNGIIDRAEYYRKAFLQVSLL